MKFSFLKKKKEYVLMHGDREVLQFEYDNGFSKIIEICHAEDLPLGTSKGGRPSLKLLNEWYSERVLPSNRYNAEHICSALSIENVTDLYLKDHARSLSDTFWFKEKNEAVTWNEVYSTPFDDQSFFHAQFTDQSVSESALYTPNNMTSGSSPKAWMKENGSFSLYKGSTDPFQISSVNEWLSSEIGKILGIDVMPYRLDVYENIPLSVSPCICNDHTDFVNAEQILSFYNSSRAYQLQYNTYISILEKRGIKNVKKKLSDMFVLDYLLMNTNRKPSNMGVLIDTKANIWKDIMPIFDNGDSLACRLKDDQLKDCEAKSRYQLFNATDIFFDELFPFILFDQYDFTEMKSLPQLYGDELVKLQKYTHISDKRIEFQYTLFYKRILALMKAQKHSLKIIKEPASADSTIDR